VTTTAPLEISTPRELEVAFDRLSAEFNSDFLAAKTLVNLVETASKRMSELAPALAA
jgi:hypothetical protein